MKKLLLLISAIFAIAFTSCTKDDDAPTLSGTTWEGTTGEEATAPTMVLSFAESTFNYKLIDTDGTVFAEFPGTYIFDGKTMVGKLNATLGDIEIVITMTGVVAGNDMTVTTDSDDTVTIILKKK